MGTGVKIALSLVGVAVLSTAIYIGYTKYWNMPSLVSKSGKKMTIKFRGKKSVIDVDYLSKNGLSTELGGGWSLSPSYANVSDKSTLNGLYVKNNKDVIYRTFYF